MNIRIEKYDNQGRGIGYYNNKIVFIPGAIVGEIVSFKIVQEKEKYIIGSLESVIKSSLVRIKEKCPFYDKCGGCSFLHLSVDEELRIKKQIIIDLFNKEKIPVPEINVVNSDNIYNYRNKVTLKIKEGKFGYYDNASHNFVAINYCYLVKDSINKIIKSNNLFKIIDGEIVIRSNYNDEIIIKIASDSDVKIDVSKLVLDNKIVGIIVNDKVIYGDDNFIEKVHNYLFNVNVNSFFQVNLNILEKISKIFNGFDFDNVVDLYCGVGVLGTFVRKNKLYGIEIVEDAIKNAKANAGLNKQCNNKYLVGDSSLISKINSKVDGIILDPPRSGLNKETLKNIVRIKPNKIVYMSCNPITFIRDMKVLNELYDIKEFYLLNMFSRTSHFEVICYMEKNK